MSGLLSDPLYSSCSPAEHKFGILGDVLLHQIIKQRFQNVCEVLQLAVQSYCEQRCHVGTISGRECPLALQSVDELKMRREKHHIGEKEMDKEGDREKGVRRCT